MSQTAYSVTGLARVRNMRGETPLVRLRNPGGRGEWNGPWSERSWEWDSLSERDKELLSIRVRNEGEFWMSFEDFSKQFTLLDLVHIGPDDWMNEPALHSKKPWRAVLARRRWRAGYNAGGGPNHLGKQTQSPNQIKSTNIIIIMKSHSINDVVVFLFAETTAMNPQFYVQIPRTDSAKCHVVVSCTQHYETRAEEDKNRNRTMHAIGFAVYEVPPNVTRLTTHFVTEHVSRRRRQR